MPRGRRGRPGLVGTMARTAVVAGTATAVVGHSQNKQAAKQADAQQQQIADMQAQLDQQAQQAAIDAAVAEQVAAAQAAPPPPPPAAPAAGGSDMMADLQKLADMKAQGLLTDEEFASMKAKLLA
jgi:type VI protein secretion system component VasK